MPQACPGANRVYFQLGRPRFARAQRRSLCTFAMIMGVNDGRMDEKTYGPAGKDWPGLVDYINADGDVTNACQGTNKKNDLQ